MPISTYTDWLVGGVALVIGVASLGAAAFQPPLAFELPKIRLLERHYGRTAARGFLAMLGLILTALGIAVATGWKW